MRRAALILYNWLRNIVSFIAHKTDYILILPPLFSLCIVYSRFSSRRLVFNLRPGTSDVFALIDTFLQEHYSIAQLKRGAELLATYQAIQQGGRVPLIMDCGANCGLSAAYFADRYPTAKIVAIEPDADNVTMMRSNVSGDMIDILPAAITSLAKRLAFVDSSAEKDALRTVGDPTGALEGLTVADIQKRYPADKFSSFIIKIDIEGFERDLFAQNTGWIADFPLVVIELHDWMLPREANSSHFLKAIATQNRDFVCHRDNIFSIRN